MSIVGMLHWARIFDLFTGTMSAMVVLVKARAGSMQFARTNQSNATVYRVTVDLQRELAMAYAQLSRLNR